MSILQQCNTSGNNSKVLPCLLGGHQHSVYLSLPSTKVINVITSDFSLYCGPVCIWPTETLCQPKDWQGGPPQKKIVSDLNVLGLKFAQDKLTNKLTFSNAERDLPNHLGLLVPHPVSLKALKTKVDIDKWVYCQ